MYTTFALEKRPFFSVIVPCYNCKATISRLLYSIVAQDMRDDLEVILVDDCSTEPWEDEIEVFKDEISIKLIQTDRNGGPGYAKEQGAQIATGEWIIFADSDDGFEEDVLLDIQYKLQEDEDCVFAYSNFRGVFDTDEHKLAYKNDKIHKNYNTLTSWTHGKFINNDNFWKKYDCHFIDDLRTHEDTYISTYINTVIHREHLKVKHINRYTYIWFKLPNTITSTQYYYHDEPHNFLEIHFLDYLRATSGCYKEEYLIGRLTDKNFVFANLMNIILMEYFYVQAFYFQQGDKVIQENIDLCRRELVEFKELSGMKNIDIYKLAAAHDAKVYYNAMDSSRIGVGNFIPKYSLEMWLDFLHRDV